MDQENMAGVMSPEQAAEATALNEIAAAKQSQIEFAMI